MAQVPDEKLAKMNDLRINYDKDELKTISTYLSSSKFISENMYDDRLNCVKRCKICHESFEMMHIYEHSLKDIRKHFEKCILLHCSLVEVIPKESHEVIPILINNKEKKNV